jgi:hypothetical protein
MKMTKGNSMKRAITLIAALFVLAVSLAAAEKPKATSQPRCHVHNQVLQKDWVKILYGRIGHTKEFIEARQKLFPYSNKVAYGGCVRYVAKDAKTGRIVKRSPDFKQVTYCSECRSAEYLWRKENPKAH